MDDVQRQIEAWADAAAPDVVSGAVGAGEAMSVGTGSRASRPVRGRRRALAAAAVVVALVVGAAGVRVIVDDTQQLSVGGPPAGTESGTGDSASSGPSGEVTFGVLHVGLAGDEPVGTLRSASTDDELARLWADLIPIDGQGSQAAIGPYPNEEELAGRVVVSVVISDDSCPPELRGFRRQSGDDGRPDRLIPQFVETAPECRRILRPKRYVVALDWASTGDRFSVFFSGENPSGDPSNIFGYAADTEILLDRARPDPVLIDLELEATTVPSGQDLAGTVVVSNNTGKSIAIGYCGEKFAVGLENDDVKQDRVSPLCLQEGEIAPGVSTFDLDIYAGFGSCRFVDCLPGGGVPPLPPGEYETRLYAPGGLDADAPPVTVTLT